MRLGHRNARTHIQATLLRVLGKDTGHEMAPQVERDDLAQVESGGVGRDVDGWLGVRVVGFMGQVEHAQTASSASSEFS